MEKDSGRQVATQSSAAGRRQRAPRQRRRPTAARVTATRERRGRARQWDVTLDDQAYLYAWGGGGEWKRRWGRSEGRRGEGRRGEEGALRRERGAENRGSEGRGRGVKDGAGSGERRRERLMTTIRALTPSLMGDFREVHPIESDWLDKQQGYRIRPRLALRMGPKTPIELWVQWGFGFNGPAMGVRGEVTM